MTISSLWIINKVSQILLKTLVFSDIFPPKVFHRLSFSVWNLASSFNLIPEIYAHAPCLVVCSLCYPNLNHLHALCYRVSQLIRCKLELFAALCVICEGKILFAIQYLSLLDHVDDPLAAVDLAMKVLSPVDLVRKWGNLVSEAFMHSRDLATIFVNDIFEIIVFSALGKVENHWSLAQDWKIF